MTASLNSRIQVFDPNQEYDVVNRRLPHWSQAGTISFITWRTWDSIPSHVVQRWLTERDLWLEHNGIDPKADDWRSQIRSLSPTLRGEFQLHVSDRWNEHLDACHGACVLRRRQLSRIVADSLLYFDGDRYDLTDFVIMPNHVHLLVAFPDEHSMLRQCDSWKHFTATQINPALGRSGHFWQQDGFDHLVRSFGQFEYLRSYIADNPRRAALGPDEYRHMSKQV